MKQKFSIGDSVYEKSNLPKWRRRSMIIKSISPTGLITCYVIPKGDSEMTEKDFADWQIEKESE